MVLNFKCTDFFLKVIFPSSVWIKAVTLEKKKIFKFCQCIFDISLLSAWLFIWTIITFYQRCFVPSLNKIGPFVMEKKIFKICFVIILIFPRKIVRPFFWINVDRILLFVYLKFRLLVLEKILKYYKFMYFYYFVIISPWIRAWSFSERNLNPALCQVLLKLTHCFGEEIQSQ